MEQKKKERKAAAALPAIPAIMKAGKSGGLVQALFATKSVVMGAAAVLGIATVGGFHAYEKGAQQRTKPTISQFAAAKIKAKKTAPAKVLTEREEGGRMLATDNSSDLASNASADMGAEAGEDVDAAQESVDAPAAEIGGNVDAEAFMDDMDLSALAEDEDSRAAKALAAKMKRGAMPRMSGKLSGLGGISGGGSGASAGGGQLAKLSATRGGGAARSASAAGGKGKSRGLSRAHGKKTVDGKKGGSGRGKSGTSNVDKLRDMKRKFKGADGTGNTTKDYSTQQKAWDSGRGGVSSAGGEESGRGGSAGTAAQSGGGGGFGGSPYSDGYSAGYGVDDTMEDDLWDVREPVNITPYQKLVDFAQAMLVLTSILLVISATLALIAYNTMATPAGPVWFKAAKLVAKIAVATAAMVALAGVGIMLMGQQTQGAIYTGVGALMTVAAYLASQGDIKTAKGSMTASELTAAEVAASSSGIAAISGAGAGAIGGGMGQAGSHEEDFKESSGYNEYEDDKAEAQADQDEADADYDEERRRYWEKQSDDDEWYG